MEIVDPALPEHAQAIDEIKAFLLCPNSCRLTGRVKEDLVRLKLAKGDVLDEALRHINAGATIYCQPQTMYFDSTRLGYIIRPLMVKSLALYFKVALPPLEDGEKPYLQILASHEK